MRKYNIEFRDAYLWLVPRNVEGSWTFKEDGNNTDGNLSLVQRYQRIGGVTVGGKPQPLLGAALQGDKLSFSFIDAENNLRGARDRRGQQLQQRRRVRARPGSQISGRKRQPATDEHRAHYRRRHAATVAAAARRDRDHRRHRRRRGHLRTSMVAGVTGMPAGRSSPGAWVRWCRCGAIVMPSSPRPCRMPAAITAS